MKDLKAGEARLHSRSERSAFALQGVHKETGEDDDTEGKGKGKAAVAAAATKTEAPKAAATKTEAPKAAATKTEAPKAAATKTEAPKAATTTPTATSMPAGTVADPAEVTVAAKVDAIGQEVRTVAGTRSHHLHNKHTHITTCVLRTCVFEYGAMHCLPVRVFAPIGRVLV